MGLWADLKEIAVLSVKSFQDAIDKDLQIKNLENQLDICMVELKRLKTKEDLPTITPPPNTPNSATPPHIKRTVLRAQAILFDNKKDPYEKIHEVRKILSPLLVGVDQELDARLRA